MRPEVLYRPTPAHRKSKFFVLLNISTLSTPWCPAIEKRGGEPLRGLRKSSYRSWVNYETVRRLSWFQFLSRIRSSLLPEKRRLYAPWRWAVRNYKIQLVWGKFSTQENTCLWFSSFKFQVKCTSKTITFKIIQVNESSDELRGSVFNACSHSFVSTFYNKIIYQKGD